MFPLPDLPREAPADVLVGGAREPPCSPQMWASHGATSIDDLTSRTPEETPTPSVLAHVNDPA